MDNEWASLPLDKKLKEVKTWCSFLPGYFKDHVLTLKDNAVQAFNEKKYAEGYKWAGKALLRNPFNDTLFLRDVLYHFRQHISGK